MPGIGRGRLHHGRRGRARRGPGLLAAVLAVTVSLSGCVGSGPAEAARQEGFRLCVDRVGIDSSELDGLDRASQFTFWEQPGAMACAVQELTDRQLAAAVRAVFDDSPDYGDPVAVAQARQRITRVLALDVARADGEEPALRALERLFEARPGKEYNSALARVGALVVVQVVDGDWEDYPEFLREREVPDSHDALLRFFSDRLQLAGREAEYSRVIALADRLADATER